MSWPTLGVFWSDVAEDCFMIGVVGMYGCGVLSRLGLVACGSAVFQVTRGS